MSTRTDRHPTPLWRRAIAMAIDALPALAVVFVLAVIAIGTDPEPPDIPPWNWFDVAVDYFHLRTSRLLLVVVLGLGATAMLQSLQLRRSGCTLGMRVMGLRAAPLAMSTPPTVLRYALWQALGIGLGLFAAATWWWGFVDMRRLTLHDRLAGIGVFRR
jgi:uncharacterized RDD family membrane protein YckC